MPHRQHRFRALRVLLAMIVMGTGLAVFGLAGPAHADPGCQQGGAYVLFVRGSGEKIDDSRAQSFQHYIMQALANEGVSSAWAELGNLDGNGRNDPERLEYSAVPVNDWNAVNVVDGAYAISVNIGVNELVTHLNHRYGSATGDWVSNCNRETLVLGGYSQGANVIGNALRSGNLSQAARDHLGYAALYGDPKFNPGYLYDRHYRINFQSNWWWVRGDDAGFHSTSNFPYPDALLSNEGRLIAAQPYVPEEFKGRFGSWCAAGDWVCSSTGNIAIHGNAYDRAWIAKSADEIAYEAKLKRNQLDYGGSSALPVYLASAMPYRYIVRLPSMASYFLTADYLSPEPPPTITQVKRTTGPDATRQVYASTKCAITEGWWDSTGVHTSEAIHISQCNIVGFDKVNEPGGVTQSLYTAVPDGVWETYWGPDSVLHHNQIVTGLSGVRQVVAAGRQEPAGYTHRLYVLADDGPYEVWWRDGDQANPGVHVNRLDSIAGPVTMVKSTSPEGYDQLYVATPTWVYELEWGRPDGFKHRDMVNISQGDIRSLDKDRFQSNGELLYVGTSTGVWQGYWVGDANPETHAVMSGQVNGLQVRKTNYSADHQIYLATGDHVQEYWWRDDGTNGTSELIRISQNDITSFDKSNDGAYQQVYTGTGNGDVWETWWGNGQGPVSKVLFKVGR